MSPAFDPDLAARIESFGVVAVLVVDKVEDGVPLAKALIEGGIGVMELTLRTPAALGALREIRREVPDMVAGVGTILTPAQVHEALEAGAAFGVAPGMNRRVVAEAVKSGLSFAPGIATPSDIEAALEFDCRLLKFFPCEPSGGLPFLKTIAAPYAHLGLKYIPLGGVNQANMAAYLGDPLIAALGGSWLAPRDAVRSGDWNAIRALASGATDVVRRVRDHL